MGMAVGLFDTVSSKLNVVDTLLDRERVPAKIAVLTAASLGMWQVMHDGWLQQQKPRSTESAASMVQTRHQELHDLLAPLSVDELVTGLQIETAPTVNDRGPSAVDDYQRALSGILLDHEYGWPLLYGVTERRLRVERIQGLDTYFANASLAALFQTARTEAELARVAPLIQSLPVARRGTIYYYASKIGDLPTGNTLQEREARLTGRFRDYRWVDECITGMTRMGGPTDANSRIISRRQPVWDSFEEFQRFVDRKIQENNLDPNWSSIYLFTVINELKSTRNNATDLTQLSRIQRMMRQSLPWLHQARNQLVQIWEYPGEVDSLIRDISALPSTDPTILPNQDLGED
jgi:hypothetical protein